MRKIAEAFRILQQEGCALKNLEMVPGEGRLVYRVRRRGDVWAAVGAAVLTFVAWNAFELLSGARPFNFVSGGILALLVFAYFRLRPHEMAVDADASGLRSLEPVKLWGGKDILGAAELGQLEYREAVGNWLRVEQPSGLYAVSRAGAFCIAPGLGREDANALREALGRLLGVRAA